MKRRWQPSGRAQESSKALKPAKTFVFELEIGVVLLPMRVRCGIFRFNTSPEMNDNIVTRLYHADPQSPGAPSHQLFQTERLAISSSNLNGLRSSKAASRYGTIECFLSECTAAGAAIADRKSAG